MSREIDDIGDDDGNDDAVELSRDLRAAQAEQSGAPGAPGDDDPEDDLADGTDEDAGAGEDHPPKAKQTARERIEELARARRDAEKAAFDAEMRVIELERRLADGKGDGKDAAPAAKPDPGDFTYGEVDTEYLSAMVDWKVSQREAQIRKDADERARKEAEKSRAEHYRKRLDTVMVEGPKRHRDFENAVNGTNFAPEVARDILDSDNPVDIAYHLANNLDDLRSLSKADPAGRARIIGRLEGRYSAASAAKKVTSAPAAMGSRPRADTAGRYGPDNQDDFDRAFFANKR